MLCAAAVAEIRRLAEQGHTLRAIARRVGVARNSVRRYLRERIVAGRQSRPTSRRLRPEQLAALDEFVHVWPSNAADICRRIGISNVSVRTVQRAIATMRALDERISPVDTCAEPWELLLIKKIARRYGGADPDELESHLIEHLQKLRVRFRRAVRSWQGFVVTALRRKALNWVRDQRRHASKTFSIDAVVGGADRLVVDALPDVSISPAAVELSAVLGLLPAHLRRVVRVLQGENSDRRRAALRLGIHRNTLRRRIVEIRRVLRQRGLEP